MSSDLKIECLRRGAFRLELAPELGGIVTRFASHDREEPRHWMRAANPDVLRRDGPLASACYPLVPFSNRIDRGRFIYGRQELGLPVEARFAPHAIHGHGWRTAWQVIGRDDARLTMAYVHEADSWPWRYSATQRFQLDDSGLQVDMRLRNLGDEPMPAGLGLHPHFPTSGDVRVLAKVTAVHLPDETGLPVARGGSHQAISAMAGAERLPRGLDLGFEGWSGEAEIRWPEEARGLRITTNRALHHLVVFTPPGADFFCVEPVSHCTNAVNLENTDWGETGLVHLEPEQDLSVRVRFDPFDI